MIKDLRKPRRLYRVHYDGKKHLILGCDASPHGLAFSSLCITNFVSSRAKLFPIGKGGTGGSIQFHNYILYTAVRSSLTRLLAEEIDIPPMASSRIQRWAFMHTSESITKQAGYSDLQMP